MKTKRLRRKLQILQSLRMENGPGRLLELGLRALGY